MGKLLSRVKRFILLALSYLGAALFVTAGVAWLIGGSLYLGLAAIALGVVLVPQVTERTFKRLPDKHQAPTKVGAVLVLLVLMGAGSSADDQRRAAKEKAQAEDAAREDFAANREAILDSLDSLTKAGNPKAALAYANRYSVVTDTELGARVAKAKAAAEAQRNEAREAELVTLAKSTPARQTARNVGIYRELNQLDPTNRTYKAKLDHYSAILQREQQAEQRRRAAEQARLARMGPQPVPSAWDGTYSEVKRYLRAVARDPESVKIDGCTKVATLEKEEAWLVGCDWMARNGFGGMNRESNWFIIKQGHVIRMADASAYSIN